MLRPADTLKQGRFELTAGAAMNTLPEVTAVAQLAVGVFDWLELGAQYETYSALGQVRFGILSSEEHGFALALAVGGGAANLVENIDEENEPWDNGAVLAGITLGRRWDFFELYLGYKSLLLLPLQYSINSVKAGVRFTLFEVVVLGIEGGVTFHHAFLTLGEGAAHLGFTF